MNKWVDGEAIERPKEDMISNEITLSKKGRYIYAISMTLSYVILGLVGIVIHSIICAFIAKGIIKAQNDNRF